MPYKDPQKKKEYDKARYAVLGDDYRENSARHYHANKEAHLARSKKWRAENADSIKQHDKSRYTGKRRENAISRSKERYHVNKKEILTKARESYDPDKAKAWKATRDTEKLKTQKRESSRRDVLSGKNRARKELQNAVKASRIVKPDRCQDCGGTFEKPKLHGHHEDYSKALDVKWLCSKCHAKRHRLELA